MSRNDEDDILNELIFEGNESRSGNSSQNSKVSLPTYNREHKGNHVGIHVDVKSQSEVHTNDEPCGDY